jgi:NAD(P)-dependent dehydrogenase (short-subunit alcohol dehydrogenase family)
VSAERGGGVFGGVAYSAAKAAEIGFARALAREVGPHGVTVNSVAPGLIDTDITGGQLEGDRKAQLLAGIPVGRMGTVEDVADLITYLCRPESGYITGATYDVNGGSHIH